MFSIRRLILSGAALVALAAPAIAQNTASTAQSSLGRGSRGRSAETPAILRGLDLTTWQRSRIDALFADYRRDVRTIRGEDRGRERATSDARRTAVEIRTQRLQADIRALLTPDQRTRFDANVTRARQARSDDDRREGRRDRIDDRRDRRDRDKYDDDHDDDGDQDDEDRDNEDRDNR